MSRDWRNERRDQGERAQAQRVELGQGYPANAGYAGGGGGGNGSYRSASVSAIKWNSSAPFHSTPPRFLQAYPCTVQFGWVVCIVIPRQGRGMMLRSERALQSIRSLFLHIPPFLISQFTSPPFPNPTTNDRHPAIAITTEVTAIAATATTEEKGATTAVAAEDITVAAAHELTAATRTTNNSIPAAVALAAAAVALAAAAADTAADTVGATIKTPEVAAAAAAATPAAAVAVAAVMPEAAAAAAGTEMRVATKATTVAVAATEVQGGIQEAAAA